MTQSNGGPSVGLRGGTQMPLLGFGTWQATDQDAYNSVLHALRTGYRHIDTAAAYGNEEQVGKAVADSGVPREDIFITTKLPPDNAGREQQTIDESLRKLNTEYVDLWLVHWPPNGEARPETWKQFLAIRDKGQAREVGVSNYSTAQLDELIDATGEAPAVNQIKWGPSLHDAKRLAEHNDRSIVLEGYSPFKTTDLSHQTLAEIAAAHGVTPDQVVLRWHLEHGVVVIPKSVTPARIETNFGIFGFTLTDAEVAALDGLA
jgi:diketogulonate reductase-like aldo/keto reductase